ncbi:MAG: potassium channel family protein, partial [Polyangiales bacterium]
MNPFFFKSRRGAYGRLISATSVLAAVVLVGATAYYGVGDGRWSWFDCFYMTIITLSTVGFAETLEGMNEIPEARVVTIALIVLGSGTLLYFISSLTALIVEGDLQGILRRRSMDRAIEKLSNHVIVCGIGTTGRHIATELRAVGIPFVVIESNRERLDELNEEFHDLLLFVNGDATDDHVLELAGIARARGVISALNDDKANLFVTISARALNPKARIVAKSIEPSTEAKLRRAGADSVVAPNYIG